MRQIQPAVFIWRICFKFLFFFLFLEMCKFTCTEEFHYNIMALRSNMAAWSGCGIHRDIIYKTGGQKNQSNYFVYPPGTKHTYSGTKGQFFNHMNVQLCNCNRPPPLLSVFYNEIDDYRGGWKRKRRGGKKTGGQCCHVDALSVMPAGARAVSRAGIFCSSVSTLSLSRVTRTAYTR